MTLKGMCVQAVAYKGFKSANPQANFMMKL